MSFIARDICGGLFRRFGKVLRPYRNGCACLSGDASYFPFSDHAAVER